MRIGQKLVLGFISVALLVAIVGYISVDSSQEALQKSTGQEALSLAIEILKNIDSNVYNRIERWKSHIHTNPILKQTVLSSNENFEKLNNIQEYINKREQEWVSVPKEVITAFMEGLINNTLSQQLRKRVDFYKQEYDYKVVGEVFVTNKYGANIAQTAKTTDYYQADEQWWQAAKKDGFYINDVEYDESANIYSTSVGIRIDDEDGNLLGVMKVVLNIEDVIDIMKEVKKRGGTHIKSKTLDLKLLTKDGRIIYSTEEFKFLEKVNADLFSRFKHNGNGNGYFISEADMPNEQEELFAHAHSKGYKSYKGLGWILVAEYETKDIFASVTNLRNNILIILAEVTSLAILFGFLISISVSKPLMKLRDAAAEIGRGNLDARIEVKSNDEVGQLAASFKKMAKDLKKTTTSMDNLNKEITERHNAENKVIETIEQKSNFISTVSHELRTPLTSMKNAISLILDGADDKFNDKQKKYLDITIRNIERLSELINDVLDFQKLAAGKMELNVEDNDITEVVHEVYDTMILFANEKEIDFSVELEDNLPKVRFDSDKIIQVLTNLINNAIKFTPEPGRVSVTVKRHKEEMAIQVRDTGIGIPKDELSKIFGEFYRVEQSGEHVKGTGLGLPIVEKIVKLHGGRIEVESEPGQGSTFTVFLPSEADAVPEVSPAETDEVVEKTIVND